MRTYNSGVRMPSIDTKIIYPPRPKGKMHPKDLPFYESCGDWLAQRKFRGSRCVLHISPTKEIFIASRHGKLFANFFLDQDFKKEILDGLNLKSGMEYWLDGELMNKDVNSTNEIILFDCLQEGRYFFNFPHQIDRLDLLHQLCGNPSMKCQSGIALQVTPRLWLAENFENNFVDRFNEAIDCRQLEGLVLRRRFVGLDNHGGKEYETSNLIRCRKPFACESFKASRSGGYEF